MRPAQLGRYEIIGELGRGAMGVVYKARDPLIDRTVALKAVTFDASGAQSAALEHRFYREAKSAGRLSHPNIVTIHDVGESGDVAYIAMEFLQGRSLREIFDSGAVLPHARIAAIAAQVAGGLAYAHRHDVVHRDIKPANIMVLDNWTVKITDFGIALLPMASRTLSGEVFGSPKYISPEQVVGRQVDGRSDIFSLGAVLYEMLAGLPPFAGTELDGVLYQVLNEMPAPPSSRNPGVPEAYDRIVAKAMAKRPQDRYHSAEEMAFDLRWVLDHDPKRKPAPDSHLPPQPTHWREGDATVQLKMVPEVIPLWDRWRPRAKGHARAGLSPRQRVVVYAVLPVTLIAVLAAGALLTESAGNRKRAADATAALAVNATESLTKGVPAKRAVPVAEAPRAPQPGPAAKAPAPPPSNASITRAVPAEPLPHTPPSATAPLETAAVAKSTARVAFAVTPWGEIYVNGRKKGVSPPLNEINLPPGKHTIQIRNSTFKPHNESIELRANATVRIKHKFQ